MWETPNHYEYMTCTFIYCIPSGPARKYCLGCSYQCFSNQGLPSTQKGLMQTVVLHPNNISNIVLCKHSQMRPFRKTDFHIETGWGNEVLAVQMIRSFTVWSLGQGSLQTGGRGSKAQLIRSKLSLGSKLKVGFTAEPLCSLLPATAPHMLPLAQLWKVTSTAE